MTDQSVTVETLRAFLDAFNRHDLDAIMEFFAGDCVFFLPRGSEPWGRRFDGKAAVCEGLTTRFAGLPDVHYGDDRHWACGQLGVSEWLITGTTPDGQRIAARGVDLLEFEDGKIVRKDSYRKRVE